MPSIEASDHYPVFVEASADPLVVTKPPRHVPQYNKVNWDDFKKDTIKVSNTVLEAADQGKDASSLWDIFMNGLKAASKVRVPVKLVKDRHGVPWITAAVKRLMRKRDKARRKWQKSRNSGHTLHNEALYNRYKELKRTAQSAMRRAYWSYLEDIITETDPHDEEPPEPGTFAKVGKRFWNFMRRLKKDNSGIAPLKEGTVLHVNAEKKADILNNQYKSQFTSEDLSTVPDASSDPPRKYPSISNLTFGVDGVKKMLHGINPRKAQGPDELPAMVLHKLADELAPALTKIFEVSYNTGDVPKEWRMANISPIYKGKNSSKADAANYRPVSLTSICSKLFEHCIVKSILLHCKQHEILTDAQHGFRAKRSCETQLITLTHELAEGIAGGGQVDLILLDFSKAFDKVPHRRLLYKLHRYGIDGKHIRWIENFLTQREQRVVVEGKSSPFVHVDSGVPQGTVLGPVLFLLFINDLPECVNSSVRLFADDAAIYRKVSSQSDCRLLQKDLDNLTSWEATWQMAFHPGKCKVMRITRATDTIDITYTLRGHPLEVVHSEKYLGVILDDKLSWSQQIKAVSGNGNGKLGFLRRNLKLHNTEIKSTAYRSLCRSTLEYCCSVCSPHIEDHIDDIEKVQRKAARYVTNRYRRKDSPTEMMHKLKWESLADRRTKSRLSMTYKIYHGEVDIPRYRFFSPLPPPARLTRSAAKECKHSLGLAVRNSTIDYVQASFFYATPAIWNQLPPCVAEAETLTSFKSQMSRNSLQCLMAGDTVGAAGDPAP